MGGLRWAVAESAPLVPMDHKSGCFEATRIVERRASDHVSGIAHLERGAHDVH